jgi:hypothetical protein
LWHAYHVSGIRLLWVLQLTRCSFLQVGWWAGVSEGDDDPYGRIINISPAEGRFIAKGYSARWVSTVGDIESHFQIRMLLDDLL